MCEKILPPESGIDEQVKIASIINAMDNEVSSKVKQLKKIKAINQHMIQELLTGGTRLV